MTPNVPHLVKFGSVRVLHLTVGAALHSEYKEADERVEEKAHAFSQHVLVYTIWRLYANENGYVKTIRHEGEETNERKNYYPPDVKCVSDNSFHCSSNFSLSVKKFRFFILNVCKLKNKCNFGNQNCYLAGINVENINGIHPRR